MTTNNAKSAIVIGAGLVGAACAWQLQRTGWQVTLIDRGDPRRAASWGNAGHLATEQIQPLASWSNLRSLPRRLFTLGGPVGLPLAAIGHWLPFGLRLMRHAGARALTHGTQALSGMMLGALPAWRRLLRETGQTHAMCDAGHFVAWESERTAERGRKRWLSADLGSARAVDATADELAGLRATFNRCPVAALRFSGTGQLLDLALTREGINRALIAAGGAVLQATVAGLTLRQLLAQVHLKDGTSLSADKIVVAAGVQSAAMMHSLGIKAPMIAERGYHLESAGDRTAQLPVAFEDRSVIVTHFRNSVRIAGFTEFTTADAPPDRRKWRALQAHARSLGIPFCEEPSAWVGARPTLPDYLPAIGRSRAANNLLYAFGHQHVGVTLAAITGEVIAMLAADHPPTVALRAFDLQRFQ